MLKKWNSQNGYIIKSYIVWYWKRLTHHEETIIIINDDTQINNIELDKLSFFREILH